MVGWRSTTFWRRTLLPSSLFPFPVGDEGRSAERKEKEKEKEKKERPGKAETPNRIETEHGLLLQLKHVEIVNN